VGLNLVQMSSFGDKGSKTSSVNETEIAHK
jgi:hypothetical protein